MKALKLIFIFIAVLGMVIGMVFLTNTHTVDPDDPDYVSYYNESEEQINSEWTSGSEWSREHFENTKSYLEVREKKLGGGCQTLVDHFHNQALCCLYDCFITEFAKSDCDRIKVTELKDDLDNFVMEAPEQKEEIKTKALYDIHRLYQKAYSLAVQENFSLRPNFNKVDGTWNNYHQHRERQEGKRSDIRNDSLFCYIENISVISDGLNSLDRKLDDAEEVFKNSLAIAIVNEYKSEKLNIPSSISIERIGEAEKQLDVYEMTYKKLRDTNNRYEREFGKNPKLASLVREFKSIVDTYRNRIEKAKDKGR